MEDQKIIVIPYFIKELATKVFAWLMFLFAVAVIGLFFFIFISKLIFVFSTLLFEESQQTMVFWGVLLSTWFMIIVGISFKWVNKQ